MAIHKFSRRNFIYKTCWSILALPAAPVLLNACNTTKEAEQKKEEKPAVKAANPCEDFTGVTEADLKARQKMGYVKASPIAESKCQNCQLFLPFKDSPGCGKCQLFKGPVLTGAYCTYWAPQVAG